MFRSVTVASIFMFLLCIINARAQEKSTGIDFFKGSWSQVLSKAMQEKKIVFVDVYTDWCGPCKMMDSEVFPQGEVGNFYNGNFINYKLNAEKGEGPEIARKYGVKVYPTWLFIEANGVLKLRATGFLPSEAFIQLGREAQAPDSSSAKLASMDAQFSSGFREVTFLRKYLDARTAKQLDNSLVLDAYVHELDKQKIDVKEVRRLIDYAGRTWSGAIPVIIDHIDRFQGDELRQMSRSFFNGSLYYVWGMAIKAKDWKSANVASNFAQKLYPHLDEATRLTSDHAALVHNHRSRNVVGLKEIGPRLADAQMAMDMGAIQKKDRELYAEVMAPFLSGKRDSTKIPNFSAERKVASVLHSAKVAGLLYEVAVAYHEVLSAGDPARTQALKWARRAYELVPNKKYHELIEKLGGAN